MQQIVKNSNGYEAKIYKWRNSHDIDLIFNDGVIIRNRTYDNFKNGYFAHPSQNRVVKNLTGKKFGNLTVVKDSGKRDKNRDVLWKCLCDCGKTCNIRGWSLKSGNTKSCGCLKKDELRERLILGDKGAINRIIQSYKNNAKKRNISWELSDKEVDNIIHKPCFYCGNVDSNKMVTKGCPDGYQYNGIDRIDSNKGYIVSNAVPCCKICNIAKHDMSQKEFYEWVKRISKNFTYEKVCG